MLDKELYRKAYEQYRQWIEEDRIYLPHNLGWPSYAEIWHKYLIAMADFDWDALSEPADWARAEKLADLDRWRACVFRLEAWRHGHGKAN